MHLVFQSNLYAYLYPPSHSTAEHRTRLERCRTLTYSNAFSRITKFYTDRTDSTLTSNRFASAELLAAVSNFPKQVVVALAQCVQYLSEFEVADSLLETKFFSKFTERTHMLLNGNTITNL